jgi:hypothetical protein
MLVHAKLVELQKVDAFTSLRSVSVRDASKMGVNVWFEQKPVRCELALRMPLQAHPFILFDLY